MTRDEIINAMAMAAYDAEWGHGSYDSDKTSPFERETYRVRMQAVALAIPGLSDVIDWKSVIVPVKCTGDMLEAGKKAWRKPRLHVSHQPSDDMMTCGIIYRAMINARPE